MSARICVSVCVSLGASVCACVCVWMGGWGGRYALQFLHPKLKAEFGIHAYL